jgi:UDP-GlcNAc:undecaprenyl-phosphate GlcNAc-1-phosphate transferase
MAPSLAAFAASLLAALALTPVARRLAVAAGVLDIPGSPRKFHKGAIPRLGGAAVCAAFLLGVALAAWTRTGRTLLIAQPRATVGLLVGAIAITLVGAIDDTWGLDYRKKFAAELAVSIVLYRFGYQIQSISIPWLGDIDLGVLAFPITMLWLVGVTNAVNLIDGLDGLASGISLLAIVTVFVSASQSGVTCVLPLSAALAGAIVGFLPYNLHPARIFLGDSGALLLGSTLGALALRAYSKQPTTIALIGPVLLLGVPIMDTLVSMMRRYLHGRSPFEADHEHMHHRLLARGLSHRKAVVALYAIATAFSLIALLLRGHSPWRPTIGMLLGVGVVVVMLRLLGYREVLHAVDSLRSLYRARGCARDRLLALKAERHGWLRVRSPDELWQRVCHTAPALGASGLELRLVTARVYQLGEPRSLETAAEARFPLERHGTRYGELIVRVVSHRNELLDDERLVFEYFADFLGDALEHMKVDETATQAQAQAPSPEVLGGTHAA